MNLHQKFREVLYYSLRHGYFLRLLEAPETVKENVTIHQLLGMTLSKKQWCSSSCYTEINEI